MDTVVSDLVLEATAVLDVDVFELRKFCSKIVRRCSSVLVSDNLRSLWEATMEDVMEGSAVGPFGSDNEVSEFSDWIPIQRC